MSLSRHVKLFLLLFLLFLSEGTLFPVLFPPGFMNDWWLHPRPVLMVVVYLSLYAGSRTGLIYGLIFGLFYDIAFSNLFGVNLFVYGLLGGLIHGVTTVLHRNLWISLTMAGIASVTLDLMIYGLYSLYLLTDVSPSTLFLREVLPNGIINMLIALILYPWVIRSPAFFMPEGEEEEGN